MVVGGDVSFEVVTIPRARDILLLILTFFQVECTSERFWRGSLGPYNGDRFYEYSPRALDGRCEDG